MATQMIIRIEPDLKNKLNQLARMEGKTTSYKIRELIEDYIKERNINVYIDDLWKRIEKKLTNKGVRLKDIDNAIKEARKKKK